MLHTVYKWAAPLALGAVGLIGCAATPHPSAQNAAPAKASVGEAQLTSSEIKPQPGISPSEEILSACQLHFDNEQAAPEFCFDQTYLTPRDREVLSKVADCLTTGPLKGRKIELIGRADPRGEQEYNMALGSSRAASVAGYLEHVGVDSSRITQTSRGKLDAKGTNETSWMVDRRVDVLLQR